MDLNIENIIEFTLLSITLLTISIKVIFNYNKIEKYTIHNLTINNNYQVKKSYNNSATPFYPIIFILTFLIDIYKTYAIIICLILIAFLFFINLIIITRNHLSFSIDIFNFINCYLTIISIAEYSILEYKIALNGIISVAFNISKFILNLFILLIILLPSLRIYSELKNNMLISKSTKILIFFNPIITFILSSGILVNFIKEITIKCYW